MHFLFGFISHWVFLIEDGYNTESTLEEMIPSFSSQSATQLRQTFHYKVVIYNDMQQATDAHNSDLDQLCIAIYKWIGIQSHHTNPFNA